MSFVPTNDLGRNGSLEAIDFFVREEPRGANVRGHGARPVPGRRPPKALDLPEPRLRAGLQEHDALEVRRRELVELRRLG
ncbi:MAG TPA: hypothetical protein VG457_06095, partial [Planctomycetota bacterium]|nr:hypothetical protein [Planctomycetota bacterium]